MATLGLFSNGSSGDGTGSARSTGSKQSLRSEDNVDDEEDSWTEGWGDDDNDSFGNYDIPLTGMRAAAGMLGTDAGSEFEKSSGMKEAVIIYLLKKQLQDRDVDDNRFLSALHNLHHVGILSLDTIRKARTAMDSPRSGGVDGFVRSIVPLSAANVDALPTNRFLSDFTPLKVLGEGGYGTVIKARHNLDDNIYAVKQIPFEIPGDAHSSVLENPVFREVQALTKLTTEYPHPFICRYHTVWVENGYHPVAGGTTEEHSPLAIETSRTAWLPGDNDVVLPLNEEGWPGDDDGWLSNAAAPCPKDEPQAFKGLNRSAFLIGDHWATTKMQRTLFLQMEYCGEDTLKTYIKNECWYNNVGLFAKLILAVQYIHSHGFIHRDLKPENICVNDKKLVKVTDFGLTRQTWHAIGGAHVDGLGMSHGVGTRGYTAPEVEADSGEYGQPADIYSLGIILWEILNGGFETAAERQKALTRLLEGDPDSVLFDKDEAATELMQEMIQQNPGDRPTIADIISTRWFQQFGGDLTHTTATGATVVTTPALMAPPGSPLRTPRTPSGSPLRSPAGSPMHRNSFEPAYPFGRGEPTYPFVTPPQAPPSGEAAGARRGPGSRDDCKEDDAARTAYHTHMKHETVRRQHSGDPDFKKMLAASLREELRQLEQEMTQVGSGTTSIESNEPTCILQKSNKEVMAPHCPQGL